ncbi:MAG: putative toxin-antitoxin system toxin component, PIN family [Lentimicrobiaceae bacterium]|nr:putative toxin-antitoxin system toxin component, PIN family [Lentimicrobiaceae bacterium]
MKIVLDTNCLLPAIFEDSPHYWIWEAFENGGLTLCCSTEILEEYGELLARFYSVEISESVINTITNAYNFSPTTPYYKWNLISADPDDNKFVDCALNGGADYIVTNDKHFNVLKEMDFPYVQVVSSEEFRQILLRR